MRSNIISVVVVNIIAFGFIIFTVFARFGTHIEVLKRVDSLPVSVGYANSTRMVLMEAEDEDLDRFWVDAKYVFGTDNERELRHIIDDEDTVELNVFIDPRTDEVLGITTKGTSVMALILNNHKLFRYGIPIILIVDIFMVTLILMSNRQMSQSEKSIRLEKYAYHPSNPARLKLKTVLHKMRDFRLLYIFSIPLWLILLALGITCITTWVNDDMSEGKTILTGITIGVYVVVFIIYFLIDLIIKNKDMRPQILQNMRAFLPGTPENIFDDIERDLSGGMSFLKSHNLGISGSYVFGSLNLNTLNPIIIPRSEVVEVVYEIFEGRRLTIASGSGVTNARQFYQNFFFRLNNGNYIPVQVNDKFGLWIAITALQKAGYRTVELNRDEIRNALRSRRNRNSYVMQPERIVVRWDDSTHIIPLPPFNGYKRFEALYYTPENKLSTIISRENGDRDSFAIDEDMLMLKEGKTLSESRITDI